MKAVYLKNPQEISLTEQKKPVPTEGQAFIRIVSAGICGSDIGAYRGTNKLVSYPRIIGHELAGIVEDIREPVSNNLKIGDKVIIDPYLYCGKCYPCRIGRTNCCTSLKVLGVHVDGGMAEYFCHPSDKLIKIPDDMDWIDAALVEPLTISLHGIHRGNLKSGEFCVIIGAGAIGILAGMTAQLYGAHAILIDLVQERLDLAQTLGIEYTINSARENPLQIISQITNGEMAQQVMECSGAAGAIRSTLDYVSHAGRITFTGWPKEEIMLPTGMITQKEIDIRGARTSAGEFEEALQLIYTKKIPARSLLTKVISLDEAPETIRSIAQNPQDFMKVAVQF